MDEKARVYRRPWRGALLSASAGYLLFLPLSLAADAMGRLPASDSIPGAVVGIMGAIGIGLVFGIMGLIVVVGLIFWAAALIAARALLQLAESHDRHGIKILVVGGGSIGLILGGAVALLFGELASGSSAVTIGVGVVDGLIAVAILRATSGRRHRIDMSAVF